MKTIKMILAWMLVFGMMFTCAFAEDISTPAESMEEAANQENADENPVVARLREHEIRLQDVISYAQSMYSEGLITSETDYASALDYLLIYNALPKVVVSELLEEIRA